MLTTLKLINVNKTQQHPFHVMHSSKLPMFLSLCAGSTALLFVAKLHATGSELSDEVFVVSQLLSPFFNVQNLPYLSVNILVILGILSGVVTMASWSKSLTTEAGFEGRHTFRVQLALKYGMLLFLVSEAMLFFPFF